MTETLGQKQTRFALWVPRLIDKAFALGYTARIGEAWRTPEQCEWDADHGTGISHSLHAERLAIDLLMFRPDGTYIADGTGYTELGTWWKLQQSDFCWGGDFHSRDYDHFSLTPDGGATK